MFYGQITTLLSCQPTIKKNRAKRPKYPWSLWINFFIYKRIFVIQPVIKKIENTIIPLLDANDYFTLEYIFVILLFIKIIPSHKYPCSCELNSLYPSVY